MTNTTFIASHEDMYSFCSSRNPDNERLLKKQGLRRPIRDEPKERLRKRMGGGGGGGWFMVSKIFFF